MSLTFRSVLLLALSVGVLFADSPPVQPNTIQEVISGSSPYIFDIRITDAAPALPAGRYHAYCLDPQGYIQAGDRFVPLRLGDYNEIAAALPPCLLNKIAFTLNQTKYPQTAIAAVVQALVSGAVLDHELYRMAAMACSYQPGTADVGLVLLYFDGWTSPGGDQEVAVPTWCPHTIGYWKTHPERWPEWFAVAGFTREEVMSILWMEPKGDPRVLFLHQYFAALLNVSMGANPDPIQTILAYYPGSVDWRNPALGTREGKDAAMPWRDQLTASGYALDRYNNGYYGTCAH